VQSSTLLLTPAGETAMLQQLWLTPFKFPPPGPPLQITPMIPSIHAH